MTISVEPFAYENGRAPKGYECGACGVRGVKLFRLRNDSDDAPAMLCADCAVAETPGSEAPDDRGTIAGLGEHEGKRFVGCGRREPAIPTKGGRSFATWTYPVVNEGMKWWYSLPTYPSPPMTPKEAAPWNVIMEFTAQKAFSSAIWGTYSFRWQAQLALTWFRIFDAMPGCVFRLEGTKQAP